VKAEDGCTLKHTADVVRALHVPLPSIAIRPVIVEQVPPASLGRRMTQAAAVIPSASRKSVFAVAAVTAVLAALHVREVRTGGRGGVAHAAGEVAAAPRCVGVDVELARAAVVLAGRGVAAGG